MTKLVTGAAGFYWVKFCFRLAW